MQEKKITGTIKKFQEQFGSNHETYLGVAVEAMIRERVDTFVRKNCMSFTTAELFELRGLALFYDELPPAPKPPEPVKPEPTKEVRIKPRVK